MSRRWGFRRLAGRFRPHPRRLPWSHPPRRRDPGLPRDRPRRVRLRGCSVRWARARQLSPRPRWRRRRAGRFRPHPRRLLRHLRRSRVRANLRGCFRARFRQLRVRQFRVRPLRACRRLRRSPDRANLPRCSRVLCRVKEGRCLPPRSHPPRRRDSGRPQRNLPRSQNQDLGRPQRNRSRAHSRRCLQARARACRRMRTRCNRSGSNRRLRAGCTFLCRKRRLLHRKLRQRREGSRSCCRR